MSVSRNACAARTTTPMQFLLTLNLRRRHRPTQRAAGGRKFLKFFSWIVERLDVPPNAPRELTFLPAVDVPAERKRRAVKYSGAFHLRAHRPMLGCIG